MFFTKPFTLNSKGAKRFIDTYVVKIQISSEY